METPDTKVLQEIRDEIKNLNQWLKKTEKVDDKKTAIVFIVAMVSLLVAASQLLLSFAYFNNPGMHEALGVFMALAAIVILYFFLFLILRSDKK